MEGANRSLTDFVSFLGSSDMYGSMSVAAGMMGWLIKLVVTVLMIAAVIGVAFIVFKFACDVIFLSGLGHMMKGNMASRVEGFASKEAIEGDIISYIKRDAWKLLVTLAFVGILASGMALPLAGQVAGLIGAGIGKLVGVDLAGKVQDFNLDDFTKSMELMSAKEKKAQYDLAVSEMKSYRDQLYKIGSSGNTKLTQTEIDQLQKMYANSFGKADALATDVSTAVSSEYAKQHSKAPVCVSEIAGEYEGKVNCTQ